jgi:hypothetical protein
MAGARSVPAMRGRVAGRSERVRSLRGNPEVSKGSQQLRSTPETCETPQPGARMRGTAATRTRTYARAANCAA